MTKLTKLLRRGWHIEMTLNEPDGWFAVSVTHSFWGDVDGFAPTLDEAIDQAYKAAMEKPSEMAYEMA